MHELSIISNVINIVSEKASELKADSIAVIELDVGTMAGVDYDALDFAWQNVTKNEWTKHTKLVINKIQGKANCRHCHAEFDIHEIHMPCPECGEYNHEILCGQELKIKSIQVT